MNNNATELLSEKKLPQYPYGSRLSKEDDRFWLSEGIAGELIVFVEGEGGHSSGLLENVFTGLELAVDARYPGGRLLCQLSDLRLKEKFLSVMIYIADRSIHYKHKELFHYILKELTEWSGFLRPTNIGITEAQQIGLWGELYVLSQFYGKKLSPKVACGCFLGPLRAPQDFGSLGFTLEIKTTQLSTPKALGISSLEQLNANVESQGIALLEIDKLQDGVSLKELNHSIESMFASSLSALMEYKKKVSELLGIATEDQISEKFKLRQIRCWDVGESFPKLTKDSVPQGVVSAQYKIDIVEIEPFRINTGIEGFIDGQRIN